MSKAKSGELNGFLDRGASFKGELEFEDTMRIDGRFTGKIVSKERKGVQRHRHPGARDRRRRDLPGQLHDGREARRLGHQHLGEGVTPSRCRISDLRS